MLLVLPLQPGCSGSSESSFPAAAKVEKKKFASGPSSWWPLLCSQTNPEEYPVEISTENWIAKELKFNKYANNTATEWKMLFNNNVQWVGLRFDSFEVERDYDKLDATPHRISLSGVSWRCYTKMGTATHCTGCAMSTFRLTPAGTP